MGAETGLTVLEFFMDLPAFGCMVCQPHLVRRRRLFLCLSEESRKEVMKGELETKSREESLEEPEEGLSRLSLVLGGSLPSLSSEVSPPSTRGNNMAFHFYQLLSRLDLQNLD